MKNLFFAIIYVFIGFQTAFTQSFPQNSAHWEGSYIGLIGIPLPLHHVMCGDTTINGEDYNKIVQYNGEELSGPAYLGATRVEGPKSYIVFANQTEEVLLYDFSLETGDSLVVDDEFGYTHTIIVDSTGTVEVAGEQRKIMYFFENNWFTETWVEGIGSSYGPAYRSLFGISDFDPYVRCFKVDNEIQYQFDVLYPSPCTVDFQQVCPSLDPIVDVDVNFNVYLHPNPMTDKAVLTIENGHQSSLFHLQIVDVNGKVIKEEQSRSRIFEIYRENMKPATYFLVLKHQASGQRLVEPLILIN